MNESAITDLVAHIEAHKLAVLAGAGISFAPPTCAPLFRPLRDMILRALTESLQRELSPAILQHCGTLFNASQYPRNPQEPPPEVLFEAFHSVLGASLIEILRLMLTSNPNTQHKF